MEAGSELESTAKYQSEMVKPESGPGTEAEDWSWGQKSEQKVELESEVKVGGQSQDWYPMVGSKLNGQELERDIVTVSPRDMQQFIHMDFTCIVVFTSRDGKMLIFY
ncbi:unnamed protein product [Caretta caretta]